MKPTARLFQCGFCHNQAIICSGCDRGHIYCSDNCSTLARGESLRAAGKRYQATINGKHHHAARQARYEMKVKTNLTHHSSPLSTLCAPMQQLENSAEKIKINHEKTIFICCFCKRMVSQWLRNDFLQRKNCKKTFRASVCPQAP
jgi:hypothetical protein